MYEIILAMKSLVEFHGVRCKNQWSNGAPWADRSMWVRDSGSVIGTFACMWRWTGVVEPNGLIDCMKAGPPKFGQVQAVPRWQPYIVALAPAPPTDCVPSTPSPPRQHYTVEKNPSSRARLYCITSRLSTMSFAVCIVSRMNACFCFQGANKSCACLLDGIERSDRP